MQDADQRLFGTRIVSFDEKDVKATYFDTQDGWERIN